MATAKKAAAGAAKTTKKTAAKAAPKAAPKAAAKTAAKAAAPKVAAKAVVKAAAVVALTKPIKKAFSKTELVKHLAENTGVDPKAVKSVVAALEATILLSLHKNGLGQFTMPGLLKATVVKVPAKKKRFGKDPFTGAERWFPAKPASTKIKVRPMKKLKDAATA